MVLEVLVNPSKVSGKPWEMFFIGGMYSLVSALLAFWVFDSYVSVVMVTFTTIAAIPFVRSALVEEEAKERESNGESMVSSHMKILSMFTFLFLGFVTVFLSIFLILPEESASHMFAAQVDAIQEVQNSVTGSFWNVFSLFGAVLLNNLKVLVLCLIFSLIYGSGAIFILAWNASVMGSAIGIGIERAIDASSTSFQAVSTNLMGYFLHGIPEILAYFVGGLAGGILSVAIVNEKFGDVSFKRAFTDSINLVLFAVIVLVFAGLIEVFVSPSIL